MGNVSLQRHEEKYNTYISQLVKKKVFLTSLKKYI